MVYTSYYAVAKKLPKSVIPISISRGTPSWYFGKTCISLAPLWETVKKYKDGGSWEDYTEEFYSTVLNNRDQHEILNELMQKSEGKDVVLLCYEKYSDNCHRHLVAEWFRKAGIDCREYTF